MRRNQRSTVCLAFFMLLAGLWLLDAVEKADAFRFDPFGWAGRTLQNLGPKAEPWKDASDEKDRKDNKNRKERKDRKDLKDPKDKV